MAKIQRLAPSSDDRIWIVEGKETLLKDKYDFFDDTIKWVMHHACGAKLSGKFNIRMKVDSRMANEVSVCGINNTDAIVLTSRKPIKPLKRLAGPKEPEFTASDLDIVICRDSNRAACHFHIGQDEDLVRAIIAEIDADPDAAFLRLTGQFTGSGAQLRAKIRFTRSTNCANAKLMRLGSAAEMTGVLRFRKPTGGATFVILKESKRRLNGTEEACCIETGTWSALTGEPVDETSNITITNDTIFIKTYVEEVAKLSRTKR